MRFDLLDEYSSLVPSGRGISRNGPSEDPTVPIKEEKPGAIANFARRLGMLGKLFRARRPMALSGHRTLATK